MIRPSRPPVARFKHALITPCLALLPPPTPLPCQRYPRYCSTPTVTTSAACTPYSSQAPQPCPSNLPPSVYLIPSPCPQSVTSHIPGSACPVIHLSSTSAHTSLRTLCSSSGSFLAYTLDAQLIRWLIIDVSIPTIYPRFVWFVLGADIPTHLLICADSLSLSSERS